MKTFTPNGLFAELSSSTPNHRSPLGQTGRRPARSRPAGVRPHLERLEERQLLSGFGPEDGAYIVEPRQHGAYLDVKIQPADQAIMASGFGGTLPNGTISFFGVERYDSSGNPDAAYNTAGLASPLLGPGQKPSALILQPDGKAVVAGQVVIAGGVNLGLARLNADGSPDATFGTGGWTGFDVQPGTDSAVAVGLQSTGKIVIAGQSISAPGSNSSQSTLVARFTSGGTIDNGSGGFGQLTGKTPTGYQLTSYNAKYQSYNGVAVQPDDKLVTVGYLNYPDGSSGVVVARYTAAGVLDRTFNNSGYAVLSPAGIRNLSGAAVALQADGKIVVTGSITGVDGSDDMLIARFKANGSLDTGFAGGKGYVRLDIDGTASLTQEGGKDVAIQPDGKIVVAGFERDANAVGGGSVMVARLNSNGTMDATFGTGGIKLGSPLAGTGFHDFRGYAVALQSDGNIIVAGIDYWGTTGDTQHPLLMRFLPTTASPLQAAGVAAPAASHAKPLTLAQVRPLLTEALARWQATGADVSGLGNVDIRIDDLGGATLGLTSGHTITLDDNAAGWGWNVGHAAGRGRKAVAGRMNLLSVVVHEVGHLLGHNHAEGGVMAETLAPGVRQVAAVPRIVAVTKSGHDHPVTVIPQVPSRLGIATFQGRGRRLRAVACG